MTELETLKAENDSLKDVLANVNAEKSAIDQLAMQHIQQNVRLQTQLNLMNVKVQKLEADFASAKSVPVSVADVNLVELQPEHCA